MTFIKAILENDFLQYAILASALASAACAVLGTYTVLRRNSYMVGAVSHSLLGGIGGALYCQKVLGIAWLTPFTGAIIASLIVSMAITLPTLRGNSREDTILSGIWTVGIALGLCFIALLPGYREDLNSYLFGNILLISRGELIGMLVLDAFVLLLAAIYHNRFLALFFNSELLPLHNISIFRTTLLLNVLTGLAVVLLSRAVGVVLVLALMVLAPSTALLLTRRLRLAMLLAALLCMLECTIGLAVSYYLEGLKPSLIIPAGAITILLAAFLYLLAALAGKIIRFFLHIKSPSDSPSKEDNAC